MGPWPDPARGAPSPHLAPTAQPSLTASPQTEELLDLIASSQSRRLDDQRASVGSLPGLRVTHSNLGRLRGDGDPQEPGDDFFNMLVKCQVGLRLGDWGYPPPHARPCLPPCLPHAPCALLPVPAPIFPYAHTLPPCPPPRARPSPTMFAHGPHVPLHLQAAQGPFTFAWGGGSSSLWWAPAGCSAVTGCPQVLLGPPGHPQAGCSSWGRSSGGGAPLGCGAAPGPPGRARQQKGSGTSSKAAGKAAAWGTVWFPDVMFVPTEQRKARPWASPEILQSGPYREPPSPWPTRPHVPAAAPDPGPSAPGPAQEPQGLLSPAPDPCPDRAPWGASHLGLGELQPPILPPGLLKASLSGGLGCSTGRPASSAAARPAPPCLAVTQSSLPGWPGQRLLLLEAGAPSTAHRADFIGKRRESRWPKPPRGPCPRDQGPLGPCARPGPPRRGRPELPTDESVSAQSSRIDDQRCPPPDVLPRGPTMPDEDFFSLIQRVQAKRMDEQRVDLAGSPEQEGGGSPEPRQQCQPGAS